MDPPYLRETLVSGKVYEHEMTEERHQALLDLVTRCEGKVILSGYPSEPYDSALRGWRRHAFEVPNQAAGGKRKRWMTEVVWCDFR